MKPLPQHTSNTSEWYTPPELLARVRNCFEERVIKLDPASNIIANQNVKATKFWSEKDNSLSKVWYADNVFLNPPYGRNITSQFVEKFYFEYALNSFHEGILLINSNTATKYWQMAWRSSTGVCFPSRRIAFIDINGVKQKSPPHPNTIFYVGDRFYSFKDGFKDLGVVSHI